ncbi:CbrC family protein [Streptomyces sp. NRRL B-1677]|uniref:CbrC family protein n=1 Tax=Streptomyces sp. NRRL B-1677 TaxID=2682966 RepID=UPI001E51EC3B|nr:CbrC family protein [Streptomyces sp. NRRL B-1677]
MGRVFATGEACSRPMGWGRPSEQVEHYLGSLAKDDRPTAYLFRCRSCAAHLAYSDCP